MSGADDGVEALPVVDFLTLNQTDVDKCFDPGTLELKVNSKKLVLRNKSL